MTTLIQPAGGPEGGRLARAIAFARDRWQQIVVAAGIVALASVAVNRYLDCDELPDFRAIKDAGQRKDLFIERLVPMAEKANREIFRLRRRLLEINTAMAAGMPPGAVQRNFLEAAAASYEIPVDEVPDRVLMEHLLRRVDTVPVSLVVAQAAIESGWGTSRFARRGNNLFGMRTYGEDTGMVPREREQGESFRVAVYAGACDAIRSYIHNLNTDVRYHDMRVLRERLRKDGGVTGDRLADGLLHYSERGADYVGDVKSIIASNSLGRFDS